MNAQAAAGPGTSSAAVGAPFAPTWLQVADVKAWLRINSVDTADDDLITATSAMAEKYVERCRPEFAVQVTAQAAVRLDIRSADGHANLRIEEWQTAHPGATIPGRAITTTLFADPVDYWATLNPALPAQYTAYDPPGSTNVEGGYVVDVNGGPVSSGVVASWASQGLILSMTWDSALNQVTLDTRLYTYNPDAEAYQGAVMYAAREYRRRNSPAGIELFGDQASFVTRYDVDIERALHTGAYAPPIVS
jgi:hypothetical protein